MKAEARCQQWNARVPTGTAVALTRDNGIVEQTKTRGEAFVCNAGYPVIFLEGVRGYYLLDRVKVRTVFGPVCAMHCAENCTHPQCVMNHP